jgi:hypothetical protein
MEDVLTRHSRVTIAEIAFDAADGSLFARHTFTARLIMPQSAVVLHLLVSKAVEVTGAHVMLSCGSLEAIRADDVPYVLRDLAETLALEHSPSFIRAAYAQKGHRRK